jgi:predicted dithiol-disulfide oxidoreductase (DUF899 family)
MDQARVVSREDWLVARKALLVKEKEATRARDELSALRRALPMVRIDKGYEFDGPTGTVSLLDLFDRRRQLIVYHFMFDPSWDEGCTSCSFLVDNMGELLHLGTRDTSLVAVSRAPWPKIEAFRTRMGWPLPWVSSYGSDFNYDFGVTQDESVTPVMYNFKDKATLVQQGKAFHTAGEQHGLTVFLREGETIYHTYSTYERGTDLVLSTYNYLDLTPLGRQDEPNDGLRSFVHHDRYPFQMRVPEPGH